jgi:hypothetical protein
MEQRLVSFNVPDDGTKYGLIEKQSYQNVTDDALAFVCVCTSGLLTKEQISAIKIQAAQLKMVCQQFGVYSD